MKMDKRMTVPLLKLEYSEEDIKFVTEGIVEVLKSGYLTMASKVAQFERQFADWCGSAYAVGTNSGTSSIEIPLRAIGVEGKTVICPSNTYMATPIAIVHAGARVIFADCRKDDFQLDPEDLLRKIQPDTVAVLLVHIGGIISPHYDEIKKICDQKGLALIEDAAHAHGATINGKMAGTLGLAASFSFYPTKVLTTAEGGMVTTNNRELYEKSVILREHGKADHNFNVHTEFGYNWRFSELHALLGLQQMKKADWIVAERRRLAALYDKKIDGIKGVRKLKIPAYSNPAYYKYIAMIDERVNRAELKKIMKERFGISLTGEIYSDPCHSQPVFKRYPHTIANAPSDAFPQTEYVCRNHICPPLYPGLKDEEVDYVCESLDEVMSQLLH